MNRRAKIIATLGPASDDKETIRNLLTAGMDVARINFSHGDLESHAHVIQTVRETARELNRPITILQDLSGGSNAEFSDTACHVAGRFERFSNS